MSSDEEFSKAEWQLKILQIKVDTRWHTAERRYNIVATALFLLFGIFVGAAASGNPLFTGDQILTGNPEIDTLLLLALGLAIVLVFLRIRERRFDHRVTKMLLQLSERKRIPDEDFKKTIKEI